MLGSIIIASVFLINCKRTYIKYNAISVKYNKIHHNALSDLLHDDKIDDYIARDEIDEWSITIKANHKLQDTKQQQELWLTQNYIKVHHTAKGSNSYIIIIIPMT